ncbi:unnamed protein product [Phytomonas sp. EM1]|nr:unnamed protein product [Phytomonas sp. EM1]|eukprot:CCW59801.1 unnamed protein product [Phytomonas sp. isolate EM1]
MISSSSFYLQKKLVTELSIDGQNSVVRLLCAPFAFLSFVSETNAVARTLASAVAFLEGFSTENLETEVSFEQNVVGCYSIHSRLKLVPYRSTIKASSTQRSVQMPVSPQLLRNSSSQKVTIVQKSWNEEHVAEKLRKALSSPFLQIDGAIDTLLRQADAPCAAKIVLEFCSEAGILVSSSTIIDIFERLKTEDFFLANQIVKQYESELESLPNMCDMSRRKDFYFTSNNIHSVQSNSLRSKSSRSSRLQRIRKSK